MAAIAQSTIKNTNGAQPITTVTMSASDTIVYSSGTDQVLKFINTTAGSLTATIIGSTATTVSPAGLGGTVSVAAGYPVTVAAGQSKAVRLDSIAAYLSGTISITGAAGMLVQLHA